MFEQDRADQADDGVLGGKDADHLGAPLDLAVEALDRVGGKQLGAMRRREAHIGQHVGLGVVWERRELRQFWAQLIGDATPLRPRGLGIVLRKPGGDERGDDAASALAGVRKDVTHEVDAAALPGGDEDLAGRGLEAFMGVGNNQLDAAPAAAGELAQERGPERLGFRGAEFHGARRC